MRVCSSGAQALFFTIFFVSVVFTSSVEAQPRPMYVGGGIGLGYNYESLALPIFRGDTLCGQFTSGSSFLPDGFLIFEMPLGDPMSSLWITPRLQLSGLGATITTPATDNARTRNPLDSSQFISITHEYQMAATLLALSANLFVKYPIANNFFVLGGPNISYLLKRSATINDVITSPSGAYFPESGVSSRSVPNSDIIDASGQIQNSESIMAAFTLGASLDVPLSPKVMLAPELTCAIPITSIRSDYSWHVLTVSLGVALKFNIAPEPKLEVVQAPPPPPPPQAKSDMSASVKISGVTYDSTGQEIGIPSPQIRIEEFERREAYPALNYIFFDEDSASIPNRYHLYTSAGAAESFHADSLSGSSTLDVYHDELNVLGKRLSDSSLDHITLTGTNSESAKEAADSSLSKRRADAVKNYLVSVWRIDPARISVAAEGLPANPSSTTTADGSQENRRVEITTNDPSLLDPLIVSTVDRTMNPPVIRMTSSEQSALPLRENTLTLSQGTRILASFKSAGPVQQWHPSPEDLPQTDLPLVAMVHLTDSIGTDYQVVDTAHVDLRTIRKKREERAQDKIIEHYNLITFNFDKSDLTDRSRRVIREIASSITPGTTILIRGYTDITGESFHNLQLSEARASAVETALKQELGTQAAQVKFQSQGEGQANLIDNRLPEGRFLSRTVFVELQKPIQ